MYVGDKMNYYNYLININKQVCNESKVRTKNIGYFEIIGKAIDDALQAENQTALFNSAMHVASLIKLFQPFYDGNHRTALIVFGDILNEKQCNFDYERALDDMNNGRLTIPTIYEESDIVTFPSEWYAYLLTETKKVFKFKIKKPCI